MLGRNKASQSSGGETVNRCGEEMYCARRSTVWPAPSPPFLRRLCPSRPPPLSHSSGNQQICNLSVVMNRGRLQPWLPPQAQMDDSGLLKCFLHRSGWDSQGERQWAMFLCFISLFFFFFCSEVWAASATGKSWKHTPSTWSTKSDIYAIGLQQFFFSSFMQHIFLFHVITFLKY